MNSALLMSSGFIARSRNLILKLFCFHASQRCDRGAGVDQETGLATAGQCEPEAFE